jgi:carbamoyltransferase
MNILGISAFYHDSAAALVCDGEIMAAAQEERFTRKKHDDRFPSNALAYCLQAGQLNIEELDYIAFYEKPLAKFERLLETQIAYAPGGFGQFLKSMPLWLHQKLHLPREIDRALDYKYKNHYVFTGHHESHAASAFFPSPFEEAAILTMDGVGEWDTASIGTGRGNKIELTKVLQFPHSLGLLYSSFTYYTGFRVNSGEYKMMGLGPYGEPKYYDLIMDKLIDLKPDGSFRLDLSYFSYCHKQVMINSKFENLFGGPARKPEDPITQRNMDVAASIQAVTEEIMLRAARHVHSESGLKNLVLAGGVALNCVANGRILREGPFEKIWVQPAAGDAGGALGAALFVWYQLLGNERKGDGRTDFQKGSYLGPEYGDREILEFLEQNQIQYAELANQELLSEMAKLLAQDKVVGLFQGRMEFGPRALGSRSIIASAQSPTMQKRMNQKIKFRESFRPFAPSVLDEEASNYFEIHTESPYMLLVAEVKKEIQKEMTEEDAGLFGIDRLNVVRSTIPAVTHVDYSARVQTVSKEANAKYWSMIKAFQELTGCPVIINTSFNVRGEPIVCTLLDAYNCFMKTEMDYLVMGRYLLSKKAATES